VGSVILPFTQFPDDVAGNVKDDSSSVYPSTNKALTLSPDEIEEEGIKVMLFEEDAYK
jgi:hypothetical protein